MKEYLIDYDVEAEADIMRLRDWLVANRRYEYAMEYLQKLKSEVADLSFLAASLGQSKYQLPKLYHPEAKTLTVCHRKLTVIFHIDDEYVIVDKILPSSLITY